MDKKLISRLSTYTECEEQSRSARAGGWKSTAGWRDGETAGLGERERERERERPMHER